MLAMDAEAVGDKVAVHLPPTWDTDGRVLVNVNGFTQQGYQETKHIEPVGNVALGEALRTMAEFVTAHRQTVGDMRVLVQWISNEYNAKYGDHSRQYVEFTV